MLSSLIDRHTHSTAMKGQIMITQSELKKLLDYNLDTGIFTWKINRTKNAKIGSIAGYVDIEGYHLISIFGKVYKSHRLAWLYVYGNFPSKLIDHINGNKSDNKLCNLRECSNDENQWNAKISSRNLSGVKGVHWSNNKDRWIAKLSIHGKIKHCGSFKDIESAKNAIIKFRESLHKEFANHGL
jgi:hypothetical protein